MFSTKEKIFIARVLYKIVSFFVSANILQVKRKGIIYEVDITEGIEFSLFLLGGFQDYVIYNSLYSLSTSAVVLDVGAHVGIMTLQYANLAPGGHVYAFEPTHFAYRKLLNNIELNPGLKKRITPVQLFISNKNKLRVTELAYSSTKVDSFTLTGSEHPVNLGIPKSTKGVRVRTLDEYCRRHHITRVDLIKTDTEGNEYEVLQGAISIISRFRPLIIFEIGEFFLIEKYQNFAMYFDFFVQYQYSLYDLKTHRLITKDVYPKYIPKFGTTDIIAIPSK